MYDTLYSILNKGDISTMVICSQIFHAIFKSVWECVMLLSSRLNITCNAL